MQRLRLSVLNFFSSPHQALALAELCDGFGCYDRFWVGEHHTRSQIADPLAFVLLAAGITARIRVGTGAVSLVFRNPCMIAETAALAELFYPGRIDLGVTKAGAAHPDTIARLMDGVDVTVALESYDRRLTLLRDILTREMDVKALLADGVPHGPPMYVMGVTEDRACRTGDLGLGFVASFHHGGTVSSIRAMISSYRRHFRPSRLFEEPFAIVVVSGYITDDLAKQQIARQAEETVNPSTGVFPRTVSVYGAAAPASLELRRLATAVEADEVMFLCVHGDCAECYSTLAQGWGATEPGSS